MKHLCVAPPSGKLAKPEAKADPCPRPAQGKYANDPVRKHLVNNLSFLWTRATAKRDNELLNVFMVRENP